ncbi:hypothetical protein Zm00014a_042459, partial [Zea mays]
PSGQRDGVRGVVGLGRWISGGRPGLGPGELNQGRPIWVERRRSDGRPGSSLRLAGAAALVPAAEGSPETRGAGDWRGSGVIRVVGEVGEGAGSSPVGSGSGQRHRRGAIHGGAARRRGYSTPASNQTQQRAKQRAIGAGEVRYLKAGSGDSSAATGTRRGPGSTVAAARRTTGERGQREIGRGRGNWGAFRVADARAELTGAKGAAELHRRRETELGTAGLWRRRSACAQRGGERVYWAQMGGEGEGEWGSGLKWPRARWGEFHARRGRGEGGCEQLGGGYARKTGLTARAREQRESEGASARGESGRRQVGPGEQREKGAGTRKAAALTGRARCAERGGEGGARARDGPAGPKGRGGGWVGLLYLFLLF